MSSLPPRTAGGPTAPQRTVISLLLGAHLFFVVVALSANVTRSTVQQRLLDRFAFYTRTLNLDLNHTPYHWTWAGEDDVDHRIEVLPGDEPPGGAATWQVLPEDGFRGRAGYKRFQRLGRVMAQWQDDDGAAAKLAQSVLRHYLRQRAVKCERIRFRRHLLQPWTAVSSPDPRARDPASALYFEDVYAADCLVMPDQSIRVARISPPEHTARPGPDNAPAQRFEPARGDTPTVAPGGQTDDRP